MKSTRQIDEMYQFKRYFQFFFLSGQNTIIPASDKRVSSYIPTIVSLIVILLCEIRLAAKNFSGIEAEHAVMLHSLVILNMFPCLVAALESLRLSKGTQYFIEIFDIVIRRLEKRTSAKIAWKNVRKQTLSKIIVITVCCFLTTCFRFASRSPLNGRRFEIWATFLLFYKTASVLHITFYVDFLTFLISSVTSSVEVQRQVLRKKVFFDLKKVIYIMKLAKLQHLEIWECNREINRHFGTITIAIMIDSMFTITVSVYFGFFFWINDESFTVTIRKYSVPCTH